MRLAQWNSVPRMARPRNTTSQPGSGQRHEQQSEERQPAAEDPDHGPVGDVRAGDAWIPTRACVAASGGSADRSARRRRCRRGCRVSSVTIAGRGMRLGRHAVEANTIYRELPGKSPGPVAPLPVVLDRVRPRRHHAGRDRRGDDAGEDDERPRSRSRSRRAAGRSRTGTARRSRSRRSARSCSARPPPRACGRAGRAARA